MTTEKHPGTGHGKNAYNKSYFIKKFGISTTEVNMAIAEIHYGSPEQLEEFLKLKYDRK